MKKLMMIGLLFLCTLSMNAQTISGVPLEEIESEYIQLRVFNELGRKVNVTFDFGQKRKFFTIRNMQMRDTKGKCIKFNSPIEAINLMAEYGYEVVNGQYANSVCNRPTFRTTHDNNSFFILLKKKRYSHEEVYLGY